MRRFTTRFGPYGERAHQTGIQHRGLLVRQLDALNAVFQEVFGDDTLVVGTETTADDVAGWDSMSHVTLILGIETRFGVRFTQKELMSFKKVGDLLRVLEAKARS